MTTRQNMWSGLVMIVGAAVLATAAAQQRTAVPAPARPDPGRNQIGPRYGSDGALLLPDGYRRWVFIGSSLGLSYSEGQSGAEMFHETLMEPTAYDHFVETKTFREGTMLALILHGTGERVLPARQGKFANDVHGVEMAVKDSSHRPEGWAYYNFGGMTGIRTSAQAMPKASCYTCHAEHAKRDNVFLQFYPLLAEAAHLTAAAIPGTPANASERLAATPAGRSIPAATTTTLALTGLDPVQLIDGREEMGKPEIVASHGPYRYQFVSEPHRARFAADPAAFSIQNATCPVVPGASVDPALFAVHEKRIYAFATSDCVERFKGRPAEFVKSQPPHR
jgi:Cytochrome P460